MVTHHSRPWIVGQNTRLSLWLLVVAILLFSGTATAILLSFPLQNWLGTGYNLLVYGGFLLLLATASAYLNDGLIITLTLTIVPLCGVFLGGVGLGFPSDPTWLEYGSAVLQAALLLGLPLGITGFLLGAGSRRLSRRVTTPQ